MDAKGGERGAKVQDFDEYGFSLNSSRCHNYSPQPAITTADEWTTVCERWTLDENSPNKLRSLLKKGVPRQQRSQIWQLFLESRSLKEGSKFDYESHLSALQSKLNSKNLTSQSDDVNIGKLKALYKDPNRELVSWAKDIHQIIMDTPRTFPDHQLFRDNDSPTKNSLFHILTVYSLDYNKVVGYCQGMSFVGALLLMNIQEEEDAFWALVSLMEKPKYLQGFYVNELEKVQTYVSVFKQLLMRKLNKLGLHLDKLKIHPRVYSLTWFMRLFTNLPCWDTVCTICDLLFLEGVNTIFMVALAIMRVCSAKLLAMKEADKAIEFLQNIPSDLLLLKAFSKELWKTKVNDRDIELCKESDEVRKENMATETDTRSRDKIINQRPDPKDSDGGQKKITEIKDGRLKRKRRISLEGVYVDGEEEQPLPKKPKDGADSDATPTSTSTNEHGHASELNLIRSGSMSSMDREKIEMTSFGTSSQKEQKKN